MDVRRTSILPVGYRRGTCHPGITRNLSGMAGVGKVKDWITPLRTIVQIGKWSLDQSVFMDGGYVINHRHRSAFGSGWVYQRVFSSAWIPPRLKCECGAQIPEGIMALKAFLEDE